MLNKVILIGRLGKDPETRFMPNGEAVCNFSVATSESWKDQSGQRQERIEWHNVTMYRRLAEIAGQYLKKGSQVYLEGKIQTRKYQGKDGVERTAYDIIANEMKMLGGGSDGQQAQPTQGKTPAPPRRQAPAAPAAPDEDIDDDIETTLLNQGLKNDSEI